MLQAHRHSAENSVILIMTHVQTRLIADALGVPVRTIITAVDALIFQPQPLREVVILEVISTDAVGLAKTLVATVFWMLTTAAEEGLLGFFVNL